MPVILPEFEINSLLMEPKILPANWHAAINLRAKRGHYERQLNVTGKNSNRFLLVLRKSMHNEFDFSVIIAVKLPNSNRIFRLRRYNGLSHQHTNRLEGQTFYDYHIHLATERYQELGMHEDSFATPTNRYVNYEGAINCAISDVGFVTPHGTQLNLFN